MTARDCTLLKEISAAFRTSEFCPNEQWQLDMNVRKRYIIQYAEADVA